MTLLFTSLRRRLEVFRPLSDAGPDGIPSSDQGAILVVHHALLRKESIRRKQAALRVSACARAERGGGRAAGARYDFLSLFSALIPTQDGVFAVLVQAGASPATSARPGVIRARANASLASAGASC